MRSTVLDAALRLLREEGPVALRVRRVADAAGCSTMGVYTHFGGKDGLVEALWLEGFRSFGVALSAVPVKGRPLTRLRRLSTVYRAWALEHATQYELMFTRSVPEFEPSPAALAEGLGVFAILVDAVSAAQVAGAFRPGDPVDAALALWGLGHGLVMIELAGMAHPALGQDPARTYRGAVDTMLAGFQPPEVRLASGIRGRGLLADQPRAATETTGRDGGVAPREPVKGRSEKLKTPPSEATIR